MNKKPTNLKVLEGNRSKLPPPKDEPKPRPTAPECPADIDPKAKKVWSRLAPKLEKLGFGRPPETKVNSYIGYATRQFRPRPKNNYPNWKVLSQAMANKNEPKFSPEYVQRFKKAIMDAFEIGQSYTNKRP